MRLAPLVCGLLAAVSLALAAPAQVVRADRDGELIHHHRSSAGRVVRRTTASNITVPTAPTSTPTTLPSSRPTPMDYSVSYSLSDSCLLYLTSVLSSANFTTCLPFSLLLTTSSSYAKLVTNSLSSGNLTTLDNLLAYVSSPQPSSSTCDAYFSTVLSSLTSKSNCGTDLAKTNAALGVAGKFKAGVGNYQVMREAAQLKDPSTGSYCYLEALASDSPDDLYLWSLPAGTSLPSSSTPSCSKCSSLLLSHLGSSDSTTLNTTLLETAVNKVNSHCGSSFVTYHAASKSTSNAGRLQPPPLGVASLAIGILASASLSLLL